MPRFVRNAEFLVLALAAGVWAGGPAAAANVQRDAPAMASGVIAEPVVAVRRAPSVLAPTVVRLPLASRVRVLRRSRRQASLIGTAGRWVYVATDVCADSKCTMRRAGWVPEASIAFAHNFRPLHKWRAGRVQGSVGDYEFSYRIASNGTFSHWSIPCFDGNCGASRGNDVCKPGERRVGRHCVGKGRLQRYRNLVWAEGYDYLYVDGAGRLCAIYSARNDGSPSCDR